MKRSKKTVRRKPKSNRPESRVAPSRQAPKRRSAKRGNGGKWGKGRKGGTRDPKTKGGAQYVSLIERRGRLAVWLVNGSYVRKNIDEEFSNFGHHWSIDKIPPDEIWIDQESEPDEQRFFVRHALVERKMLRVGADYDDARHAANREERQMRVRAGDLRKVIKGKSLPDASLVHRDLWKTLPDGVQVWFVKGRLVRSVYDIEFTEGGHEHVYEFVPRGEVWIDDDIHEDERGFVLFHELHERNLMAKGMDYDTAHDESSRLERHLRKHPDELHEALEGEGWE